MAPGSPAGDPPIPRGRRRSTELLARGRAIAGRHAALDRVHAALGVRAALGRIHETLLTGAVEFPASVPQDDSRARTGPNGPIAPRRTSRTRSRTTAPPRSPIWLRGSLTPRFDIMMPGMDGLEVLRSSRAHGVRTPIIMLTAKGEIEDNVAGLDVWDDDAPEDAGVVWVYILYLRNKLGAVGANARIDLIAREDGCAPSPRRTVARPCARPTASAPSRSASYCAPSAADASPMPACARSRRRRCAAANPPAPRASRA